MADSSFFGLGGFTTEAIAGGLGVGLTQLANWLLQRRAQRAAEAQAAVAARQVDRDAGFRELLEVVKTIRGELEEMREEVDRERDSRRSAEEQVRTLRDELHALRNQIHLRGLGPVPSIPGLIS
ncbi:DNA recombination protein RmuC (plasmid) [Rhodovastum atsumiense]|uniref:Uncharacterized protein n=1 Tax=Rhodovastum atsumiense TaxID=504468 RepID=A0A5M6ITC5_9PROT|nr:hypothetical protein [Rhodovastum atsumiense]KAA5611566.1 hypothetical protein F1189_13455 [Rhodovastum atsumiense]CAH2606200.1 DNA recombination protein RmuC [Rhodovastum atsumiense]